VVERVILVLDFAVDNNEYSDPYVELSVIKRAVNMKQGSLGYRRAVQCKALWDQILKRAEERKIDGSLRSRELSKMV